MGLFTGKEKSFPRHLNLRGRKRPGLLQQFHMSEKKRHMEIFQDTVALVYILLHKKQARVFISLELLCIYFII